jgi:hypothetical protein
MPKLFITDIDDVPSFGLEDYDDLSNRRWRLERDSAPMDIPNHVPIGGDDLAIQRTYYSRDPKYTVGAMRIFATSAPAEPSTACDTDSELHRYACCSCVARGRAESVRGDVQIAIQLSCLAGDALHPLAGMLEVAAPVSLPPWDDHYWADQIRVAVAEEIANILVAIGVLSAVWMVAIGLSG